MVITYYGISCFKIQNGDMVLAIDPFSKDSGLTPPRFQAHIVLSSNTHENHSNIESLQGDPFVVVGPGEYEIKGISIQGVASSHNGKEGEDNTIYIVEWDGIRLVHLGNVQKKDLSEELQESIGTPDILFVPVGGKTSLDADEAATFVNQIEPRIVIPMNYKAKGMKSDLSGPERFIKELGTDAPKPEEKFTFKKKDLPQDSTKLVILDPPIR